MFRRIVLVSNSTSSEVTATLDGLSAWLREREIAFDVIVWDVAADQEAGGARYAEEIDRDCDLVIAIGGDGTMLRAARLASAYDLPLLGINRGRLGFLADVPAREMEQYLEAIFADQYAEDKRFTLDIEVVRGQQTLLHSEAVNDAVLHKWNIARLVEFETRVNGNFVHSQRSDGLIISTPTGSTAYALAAGGPILYPTLNALVLVPICPHALTNRPIVINGDSVVEIIVGNRSVDHARLTCDGAMKTELAPGDRVRIRKGKKIRLIHPQGHEHFNILRAKLHWGKALC